MKRRLSLLAGASLALSLLSSCGVGLCVSGEGCGPYLKIEVSALTLRKNDCQAFTVTPTDTDGSVMAVDTNVSLSAGSAAKIYSSQAACETYNDAKLFTTGLIQAAAPTLTAYIRANSEATVTIEAVPSNEDLYSGHKEIPVGFTAYARSMAIGATVNDWAISGDSHYLVGTFAVWDDTRVGYIARLNANGSLDKTFLPTGTGFNDAITAIVIQSDGKPVVAGKFTSYNGTAAPRIARLNLDGSLDTSFAPTSGFDATVNDLAIQSDDKIVAVGEFATFNGTARVVLARVNTNGTLDTSLVPAGVSFNGYTKVVKIQSDGKIMVGGEFTLYNVTARPYLARLLSDGTLDGTFAPGGAGLDSWVFDIAEQPDGNWIVAGQFSTYNGVAAVGLIRLSTTGARDGTFTTAFNIGCNAILLQPNGKMVIGGGFNTYGATSIRAIARLESDGSLDTSFQTDVAKRGYSFLALRLQADGRIVAGGSFLGGYLRFESSGALDTSFSPSTVGFDLALNSAAVMKDGGVAVAGDFRAYDGTTRNHLVRLNTQGTIDDSLSSGTGFVGSGMPGNTNLRGRTTLVQPDGKIVVIGTFSSYQGTTRYTVARINPTGELDNTFATSGTGFSNHALYGALQGEKVLVAGTFTSYNGTTRQRLARLNSDGTLDAGFAQTGTGINNAVNVAVAQGDQVLVGGTFTSYNGTSSNRIARLNSDGSLDTTFVVGTGFNTTVNNIVLQSDGKILVGGAFATYNGNTAASITRLNTDGSLDTTFAPTGTGVSGAIAKTIVLTDGKILIGGAFTSYNGTARGGIARLNSDGSLDASFGEAGAGFIGTFNDMILLPNSKILFLGDFTSFGDHAVNRIGRLTYDGQLD